MLTRFLLGALIAASPLMASNVSAQGGQTVGDASPLRLLDVPVIDVPNEMDRLADLVNPDTDIIEELGVLGLEIDERVSPLLPRMRIASGVIVVAHAEGWRGAEAALSTGDIIHTVNHVPVQGLAGLRATLGSITNRTPVVLQIERSGKLMFITYDVN